MPTGSWIWSKEERMNEEFDPSKWECNQITGVCRTKVTVDVPAK